MLNVQGFNVMEAIFNVSLNILINAAQACTWRANKKEHLYPHRGEGNGSNIQAAW